MGAGMGEAALNRGRDGDSEGMEALIAAAWLPCLQQNGYVFQGFYCLPAAAISVTLELT